MKILEAIESEDHKRKFNVGGQYKREMEKTTDEKPGIQHQKIRQYHYVQPSVGDGKSNFSLTKQPLHRKTVKGNQTNVARWSNNTRGIHGAL